MKFTAELDFIKRLFWWGEETDNLEKGFLPDRKYWLRFSVWSCQSHSNAVYRFTVLNRNVIHNCRDTLSHPSNTDLCNFSGHGIFTAMSKLELRENSWAFATAVTDCHDEYVTLFTRPVSFWWVGLVLQKASALLKPVPCHGKPAQAHYFVFEFKVQSTHGNFLTKGLDVFLTAQKSKRANRRCTFCNVVTLAQVLGISKWLWNSPMLARYL